MRTYEEAKKYIIVYVGERYYWKNQLGTIYIGSYVPIEKLYRRYIGIKLDTGDFVIIDFNHYTIDYVKSNLVRYFINTNFTKSDLNKKEKYTQINIFDL